MSLSTITALTPDGASQARVEWTCPDAAFASWIYVNGALAVGPILTGEVSRSALVPFESGKTAQIEIHDLPASVPPASTREVPNTRPVLSWRGDATSERYRAYRAQEGGAEAKFYDKPSEGLDQVTHQLTSDIDGQGGQWHFFRVEAVSPEGYESTRAAWPYRVMEPPAPVAVGAIDGSAPGLFTLTIGA